MRVVIRSFAVIIQANPNGYRMMYGPVTLKTEVIRLCGHEVIVRLRRRVNSAIQRTNTI